jgi:hypothetical protein
MDLAAYRRSAESFVCALTGEYYRHYAGLKASYEIEPIYDRHRDLFTAAAVDDLRARVDAAAAGGEDRRRLTMLLDFAVEGYVGQATKHAEAALATLEASIAIDVGGEELGFRRSAVVQANEPDASRREAIEQGRLAATEEQLGPLYRELIERQHAIASELGYGSYREMCAAVKGFDLAGLHAQTEAFRERTELGYPALLEPELRHTLGVGLGAMRRADLPRFFRAPDLDELFPGPALLPGFRATMRGLGFDVEAQPGVVLDVEPRPKKSPRAFCAPVRVPHEVYLVLSPVGGRDDYSVLFHEAGHTEHYANVDPALPFEFRYLGDNAITEAFAFLFQHLIEDQGWLARHLGVEDADGIAGYARAYRLVYLRRYCAKLSYELELHGPGGEGAGAGDGARGVRAGAGDGGVRAGDGARGVRAGAGDGGWGALARRYSQLLSGALQIEWPTQTFLADVDPGFYCACYLRAWALETHLRRDLRERFGPLWFESAQAGDTLRGLWREGQRLSPEELLDRLTGERLHFGVLADDLGL